MTTTTYAAAKSPGAPNGTQPGNLPLAVRLPHSLSSGSRPASDRARRLASSGSLITRATDPGRSPHFACLPTNTAALMLLRASTQAGWTKARLHFHDTVDFLGSASLLIEAGPAHRTAHARDHELLCASTVLCVENPEKRANEPNLNPQLGQDEASGHPVTLEKRANEPNLTARPGRSTPSIPPATPKSARTNPTLAASPAAGLASEASNQLFATVQRFHCTLMATSHTSLPTFLLGWIRAGRVLGAGTVGRPLVRRVGQFGTTVDAPADDAGLDLSALAVDGAVCYSSAHRGRRTRPSSPRSITARRASSRSATDVSRLTTPSSSPFCWLTRRHTGAGSRAMPTTAPAAGTTASRWPYPR